jgi:hypothetical protein
VIIWLNGTFGVGKTTTARHLVDALPDVRFFDPEYVGYMVAEHLRDYDFADFQQLEPWRRLVPTVMAETARFTGHGLVAPQTVLVPAYWHELREGFTASSLDVFHVLLDAEPDVLRARIEGGQIEPQASQWRLEHMAEYAAARAWMVDAADLVVDTTDLAPADVSALIRQAVTRRPKPAVVSFPPR